MKTTASGKRRKDSAFGTLSRLAFIHIRVSVALQRLTHNQLDEYCGRHSQQQAYKTKEEAPDSERQHHPHGMQANRISDYTRTGDAAIDDLHNAEYHACFDEGRDNVAAEQGNQDRRDGAHNQTEVGHQIEDTRY